MCGHGTIGTVTMAIEHGLLKPKTPGVLRLDTPAGLVVAEYRQHGEYVEEVRITNVPSFLHSRDLESRMSRARPAHRRRRLWRQFLRIVDPQKNFRDLAEFSAGELIRWSPGSTPGAERAHTASSIRRIRKSGDCTHIMWTGAPKHPEATARNAVFYGDKAIDRSPCGTGTSARMAQWAALGRLKVGDDFIHESIIGSLFNGRVEKAVSVGNLPGIVPSIGGWARNDRLQHHLHRRSRSLCPRVPGWLRRR